MKVILAGYNTDADILSDLQKRSGWEEDNVTPESLSASYARISRDPASVDVLRASARKDVDKSRRSNQTIIFGLGHASVAEHAVFNLDIIGVSRLATEYLQHFRFASFTEKSQRYITLNGDFVLPEEVVKAGLAEQFKQVVQRQNDAYFTLYRALKEELFQTHAEEVATTRGASVVDGWAKEDARYLLSLATETQMGMTVNARSLEYMIRSLAASPIAEVRLLADKLYKTVSELSPSIIKYTEPTAFDSERPKEMAEIIAKLVEHSSDTHPDGAGESVTLLTMTPDADRVLVAALLFNHTALPFARCMELAKTMEHEQQKELVLTSLRHKQQYDKPERAFEAVSFVFELVVSATNYAQLKRHRPVTRFVQPYSTALGVTIPDIIKKDEQRLQLFNTIIAESESLYRQLLEKGVSEAAASYALTNAHRRRVVVEMNARELYHFVSLRSDKHAQWDIRNSANRMQALVKEKAPLTALFLSGKSE